MFVKLGRHPHLTALLGVTSDPAGATCMLVEFAPCGSLDMLLGEMAERGEAPGAEVGPTPETLHPQRETRNTKHKTRDTKHETRNAKYDTQNTKQDTRNSKTET